MFKPSKYQQDVFDFILNETGSAIVEAVAGSGKSTTIIQALNMIPPDKTVCFLAFNKSIATELQKRVPEGVQCSTLNALGHRAWYKHAGRVALNASKTRDILRSDDFTDCYPSDEEKKLIWTVMGNVIKMVSIAKAIGIFPGVEYTTGLVPDDRDAWEHMIDYHDLQFGDIDSTINQIEEQKGFAIGLARHVLHVSCKMAETEIDFNDQLYLPVIYNISMFKFDYVFVDEAQDISGIQRSLIGMSLKKGGRLIAVGDKNQAIYGFRGADSKSLDNMKKLFNAKSLPLSISYRCPKSVVAEAKKYVSHIEHHDASPEGSVSSLGDYKTDMFKPDDMVICRNTAPLIKLAYKLISANVQVHIMGKDLGAGIISLIKALRARSLTHLSEKLEKWKQQEIYRLTARQPGTDISRVMDKCEMVNCFISCSGATSVSELIQAVERLFDNHGMGVVLATVHKAKGLEADNVFILDSWLMPSKFAKAEWQQEQEKNITYVAITRSKKKLNYITTPTEK